MKHQRKTRLAGTLTRLVLAVLLILTFAPIANAQAPVVGSADFRGAPQLPPGQYRDRLVTGDSAWYALVYSNNTPYRFDVAFDGVRPSDAELTASFVAPTLTSVDGPDALVEGSGVEYPAGQTNVWFLKVTMSTTGQTGVEYPILISVDGVESVGIEDCSETADCTLDADYAAISRELASATAELEGRQEQNTRRVVEIEIEGLLDSADSALTTRPRAEARFAQAQTTIASLCAPEVTCDEFPQPPAKTSAFGLIVGALALIGGAYLAVKKLRKPAEEEPAEDEALVRRS